MKKTLVIAAFMALSLGIAQTVLRGQALKLPKAALEIRGSGPFEYKAKAGVMHSIASLVVWPPQAYAKRGEIVFGILGRDPFREAIDLVKDWLVAGKRLRVARFADLSRLGPCQVLFISRSEMERLPDILKELEGKNVLTVGESEDFLERGGMVRLYSTPDHRVRFDLDQEAVQKAGLRMHQRLVDTLNGWKSSDSKDAKGKEGR